MSIAFTEEQRILMKKSGEYSTKLKEVKEKYENISDRALLEALIVKVEYIENKLDKILLSPHII